MADWTRRATRALQHELRPGEAVQAVAPVRPVRETALPDRTVDRLPERLGRERPGPDRREFADVVARRPSVMVLTDQRLLVLGRRWLTGQPTRTATTMAPSDVLRVDVDLGASFHRLALSFVDGSVAHVETSTPCDVPIGLARHVNER